MSNDKVVPAGYDRAELYFHELNQKLIDERREKLNEERDAQEHAHNQKIHWMKCPKCGEDMIEVDMKSIKVDRCTDCDGIFFDKGELSLLLESREHGNFWSKLKTRLHP